MIFICFLCFPRNICNFLNREFVCLELWFNIIFFVVNFMLLGFTFSIINWALLFLKILNFFLDYEMQLNFYIFICLNNIAEFWIVYQNWFFFFLFSLISFKFILISFKTEKLFNFSILPESKWTRSSQQLMIFSKIKFVLEVVMWICFYFGYCNVQANKNYSTSGICNLKFVQRQQRTVLISLDILAFYSSVCWFILRHCFVYNWSKMRPRFELFP